MLGWTMLTRPRTGQGALVLLYEHSVCSWMAALVERARGIGLSASNRQELARQPKGQPNPCSHALAGERCEEVRRAYAV